MSRLRKYLGILLPALPIIYLGYIITFTHIHVVNEMTIIHSHPYHKTDDGRPDHEHGYAELQLLHQLSVLQITGATFTTTPLVAPCSFIRDLPFAPVCPDYIVPFRGRRTLWAPSVFWYCEINNIVLPIRIS